MVVAVELKIWCQGHLQWHDLPAANCENLPVTPKVISGDNIDRVVIL
jgi:hypothetical protein